MNQPQLHCRVLARLGSLLLVLIPLSTLADTVISNCTQQELEAALKLGGRISFACDGTIVLTNTLAVTTNAIVDATGHEVTLSGDNQVRIFNVSTGVVFGLIQLTLANGRAVGAPGLDGQAGFGAAINNEQGLVSLT